MSPTFATDGILFGSSYNSLLASTDRGKTWAHIFRVNHTDYGQERCASLAGLYACLVCQQTLPANCVKCAPGYELTSWSSYPGETSPTAKHCVPEGHAKHTPTRATPSSWSKQKKQRRKRPMRKVVNEAEEQGPYRNRYVP